MSFIDILIAIILAAVMVNVGLSLSKRSLIVTLARPRAYAIGIFLQLIYLPAMAFFIASIAGLPDDIKVGIVILASCPGGMTSNFISYMLSANTALALSLTVTNSLVSLVTVPIIVNIALNYFMGYSADLRLPLGPTVGYIFTVTIIPAIIGALIRRWQPNFAVRVQTSLRWITIILLGVLFLIKFFASEQQGGSGITVSEVAMIFPYSLLVNAFSLSSGFVMGRLFRLPTTDQVTLGIEVGIQNTSLAFLIAASLLGNENMLKPALVYAMFTFFTAVFYGLFVRPREWSRLRRKFTAFVSRFKRAEQSN